MSKGWIKLHRKIEDCQIWIGNEPYDRRSAWISLLLMANHEDRDMIFDDQLITIKRGQLITSVRKLSQKWMWSKDRTLNFLRTLERLQMIHRESNTRRTLITLVKYEDYQIESDSNKDTNQDTERTQNGHCLATNKNDKNEKNVKKDINNIPDKRKHKYGEYNNVLLTDDERDKLFTEYGEFEATEAIKFLDEYIEMKGYKAKSHYLCIRKWVFDALKKQNGNPTTNNRPQQRDLFSELREV